MSDAFLSLSCGPNQQTDLVIEGGDLKFGNDLSTAIMISLFTDARARPDDVIPSGSDPRGWVGDAIDGVPYGSRLWLLERANRTPETLTRAKQYAADALAWLVEDGIAKAVDVVTESQGDCNVLALGVRVTKPDDKKIEWRWRYAWDLRDVITCELNTETA
jgi:phage gp46-like protein